MTIFCDSGKNANIIEMQNSIFTFEKKNIAFDLSSEYLRNNF